MGNRAEFAGDLQGKPGEAGVALTLPSEGANGGGEVSEEVGVMLKSLDFYFR